MSEEMNNSGEQRKKEDKKAKKLTFAQISFVCSIINALFAFGLLNSNIYPLVGVFGFWFISGMMAIILSVVSLLKADELKGSFNRGFAITSIIVVVLVNSIFIFPNLARVNGGSPSLCRINISSLGKALMMYSYGNNNQYPAPNKWCDLLIESQLVTEKQFICEGNKKQRCSYAINPNCEPNSSGDTVLLFETKGGWNKFGGPELITADNHNGEGAHVLYNDGHVEFTRPRDFNDLKWKADANLGR